MDFLKYLTERFTRLISEKKSTNQKEDDPREKSSQTGYSNRWFGIVPFAVKTFFKNNKSK